MAKGNLSGWVFHRELGCCPGARISSRISRESISCPKAKFGNGAVLI